MGGGRLRGDAPPPARSHLPAAGHHRAQTGRVAGENAVGGTARFAGSLGTQVVKVFDLAAARTGLREDEARTAGFSPATQAAPEDHKAYYPGAQPISIRLTGDLDSGRLLGAQLVGARSTETAKRVDVTQEGPPADALECFKGLSSASGRVWR
jgi:NADPH-dependent 2,4-dienoyl-CoA reductase/sulfur reductase-like enzyme